MGQERKYIWGIDASLTSYGIAIYDIDKKDFVKIHTIKPVDKDDKTRTRRLAYISKELYNLYIDYPPERIIMEDKFLNKNQMKIQSFMILAEVHGTSKSTFGLLGTEDICYYAPKTVKATIIHGNADKDLVQRTIIKNYPHLEFKNEDESDACAVCLTYLIKNKIINWSKI